MILTWLGCDLVTGQIIEELPDLAADDLSALLCAYTSTRLTLPIPLGGHGSPPRDWLAATEPGRSMIVAVLDGRPIWAGIVLPRRRGSGATATLGVVSLEGYLDRRYVGDHTWTQQDEVSVILTGLLSDANTTEGIGFTLDCPATGTLRDRAYRDRDDKTVYSAARELAGVSGGPEWTIALDWTDATETAVEKIFRARKRIGYASAAPTPVFTTGTAAAVMSSVGSSEATYELDEDYSSDSGANHIVAVSSGEGDSRPQSDPARDEDLFAAGWPRYEHRFTPSTSITDVATLDAHAQAALTRMARGARVLTFTARADAYPMLGRDWAIGDDIGYDLTGHGHPDGLVGVARAIGWRLGPQAGTVAPILLVPGEEIV